MKQNEPKTYVASYPRKGVIAIIDPKKNMTMFAKLVLVPSDLGKAGPYLFSSKNQHSQN